MACLGPGTARALSGRMMTPAVRVRAGGVGSARVIRERAHALGTCACTHRDSAGTLRTCTCALGDGACVRGGGCARTTCEVRARSGIARIPRSASAAGSVRKLRKLGVFNTIDAGSCRIWDSPSSRANLSRNPLSPMEKMAGGTGLEPGTRQAVSLGKHN